MKRIIIIVFTLLLTVPLFAQDIFESLTSQYYEQEGFSATKITNDMFGLYLRKKNVGQDSPIYETLKKLDEIFVISQSKSFTGEYDIDISGVHSEILDNYQSDSDYSLLKTEKKMGEDIKVYLKKDDSNKINSLALVTATDNSVNLVEMNGDIDLANLSELSKVLNLRGLEDLYKVHGSHRYPFWEGGITIPGYDFDSNLGNKNWPTFNEEWYTDLQQKINEQNFLSQEQKEILEQRIKDFSQRQDELTEKYFQMAEQYGRTPIFLTYPGEKNTKYFINGEEASAEDIKELNKEDIKSIGVVKSDKGKGYVIKITAKK